MPLLPHVDVPISPGMIGLPYETANVNSIRNQLLRSFRQMRGWSAFELTIPGSERKADFLATFAGLDKNDATSEVKLAAALDSLLSTLIDTVDEAASAYPVEDQRVLKSVAAREIKSLIADAVTVFMEDAAAELAQMRKTDTSPCLKEAPLKDGA